jgi:zinc/manganese transport system substrate-binding protein
MLKDNRYFGLVPVVILVLMLASSSLVQGQLRVVTTQETLKSLVEEIGGERVKAESITSGAQNPHYIEAKPSFMSKARRADLWVRVGMSMEIGYEPLILRGARNGDIQVGNKGHLDLSRNVTKREVHTGHVDRSMGDVHPEGNPHYWLDPHNARIMARDIFNKLSELDPQGRSHYQERLIAFLKRLDIAMFGNAVVEQIGGEEAWHLLEDGTLPGELKQQGIKAGGWYQRMQALAGRELITYHKSWGYFTSRFGLVVADQLEPKPGIPPGPQHVFKLLQTVKSSKIKVIIMEPYYNRRHADSLAEKADIKVLVVPNSVGGNANCKNYIDTIENVVSELEKALS